MVRKVQIGLIGAMQMEIAPYLEWMDCVREEQIGPHRIWFGEAFGLSVAVCCCGIGKVNAAMSTQAMLLGCQPQIVLHAGVGGGLMEGLCVGDAVIAKDCVQYDVDTTALGDPLGMISTINRIELPCDPRISGTLLAAAREVLPKISHAVLGRVATGDRFLNDGENKRRIVRDFDACLCDQESCAVAQVCFVNGVPCGVVRMVSDASNGAHQAEYQQFADGAAKTAAGIIWKFLEKFGTQFA